MLTLLFHQKKFWNVKKKLSLIDAYCEILFSFYFDVSFCVLIISEGDNDLHNKQTSRNIKVSVSTHTLLKTFRSQRNYRYQKIYKHCVMWQMVFSYVIIKIIEEQTYWIYFAVKCSLRKHKRTTNLLFR